jgi:hypothetical protein
MAALPNPRASIASLCRNALRPRPPQQLLPSDESFERKPQASVPPQARTRARRRESTSVIGPQLARTRHVSSNFPPKPTSGSCASLVPGFGRASLFAKQSAKTWFSSSATEFSRSSLPKLERFLPGTVNLLQASAHHLQNRWYTPTRRHLDSQHRETCRTYPRRPKMVCCRWRRVNSGSGLASRTWDRSNTPRQCWPGRPRRRRQIFPWARPPQPRQPPAPAAELHQS